MQAMLECHAPRLDFGGELISTTATHHTLQYMYNGSKERQQVVVFYKNKCLHKNIEDLGSHSPLGGYV